MELWLTLRNGDFRALSYVVRFGLHSKAPVGRHELTGLSETTHNYHVATDQDLPGLTCDPVPMLVASLSRNASYDAELRELPYHLHTCAPALIKQLIEAFQVVRPRNAETVASNATLHSWTSIR